MNSWHQAHADRDALVPKPVAPHTMFTGNFFNFIPYYGNLKRFLANYGKIILMPEILMGSNNCIQLILIVGCAPGHGTTGVVP